MTKTMHRLSAAAAAIAAVLVLGGCGYTLEAKVVRGSFSSLMIVDKNDSRLDQPPLQGARITVTRDADSLGARTVASTVSDGDGGATISIDVMGAGITDEDWLIRASAGGHQNIGLPVRLPVSPSSKRLLVILAPGRAEPFGTTSFEAERDTVLEQIERYSQ